MNKILFVILCAMCLLSCVPQKEYDALNELYEQLENNYTHLKQEYSDLQAEYDDLQQQYEKLDNVSELVIKQINKDVNSQLGNLNGQIIALSEQNRDLKYSICIIQDKIRYGKIKEAFQITEEIINGY